MVLNYILPVQSFSPRYDKSTTGPKYSKIYPLLVYDLKNPEIQIEGNKLTNKDVMKILNTNYNCTLEASAIYADATPENVFRCQLGTSHRCWIAQLAPSKRHL